MLCIRLLLVMLMLKSCKQNLSILTSLTIARGSGAEMNGIISIMALFYSTSRNRCSSAQEMTNIYAAAWRGCQHAHALYSAHVYTEPQWDQVTSVFLSSTTETPRHITLKSQPQPEMNFILLSFNIFNIEEHSSDSHIQ